MRLSRPRMVGVTAAGVLLAGWGCGDGSTPAVSSSTTEATVSGTVTIKGKPATKGEVTFDPANVNRKSAPLATAKINEEGTYTVTTLVGSNVVRVATPETTRDPKLQYNETTFDVQSGTNKLDIALPAPTP